MAKHTTYEQMVMVEALLKEGYTQTEIAIRIDKGKSTISKLIPKGLDENGVFKASIAWERTKENRSNSVKNHRIMPDSLLERFVLERIELHWSPEQIAGVWERTTKQAISPQTIYDYIYENHPELVVLRFRRKGVKYKKKHQDKSRIKDRRMIDERPKEVETRQVAGHWEGDTVIGKNHKQAIVTNVERKTGFLIASKVPKKTAQNIYDVTVEDFEEIPDFLKISMTYDNGLEFAKHKDIEKVVKMIIYFAHAYRSCERATNENTNGLLREFIPKGTDLDTISEEDLQRFVTLINQRPRKRHGYFSPEELFRKEIQKQNFTKVN